MRKNVLALVASLGLALALAPGCGGDDDGDHDDGDHDHDAPVGDPTGTVCPDGGTSLTYEDFGQPFVEQFCLRCHSESVEGDDRQDAPADHNFDTQFECEALAEHMDQKAGSGPDATNDSMPPSAPRPSDEQRAMLSEWLACGAP
ncbi:MAG TPA: hypothetical protein VK698_14620 [Kofleriaceae bacterium]|nr:hypothetical protein [Kofleriaceae bacterium]